MKGHNIPSLNFILVSDSTKFVNSCNLHLHQALVLVSHEFRKKNSSSKSLSYTQYQHFSNGGCAKNRQAVTFVNCSPPTKLTRITRRLGDFLDYLTQPDWLIDSTMTNSNLMLSEKSIPSASQLTHDIMLPSYLFRTGWGARRLTNKKFFQCGIMHRLERE